MSSETGWRSSAFAQTWAQGAESRNRLMAAATGRMFAEARIAEGSRVLDVGTGTGDTTLVASRLVGPKGHVVATDGAEAMIVAATEAVRASGVTNVTVRPMDLRDVDLEDASFDAVIARNVLMFVPVPRAVVGLHRVLRPGGRLAAVVWSTVASNPYHASILAAARAHGGWGDSPPEVARAFALGDANVYRRTLEGAGYRHVVVEPVPAVRRFASAAEAVETMRASPIQSEPILRLPSDKQADAWAEIEQKLRAFEKDGACEIPLESLVIAGER